jgi:pimeloyl-ACP methyl ester carboxylesterase
MMPVFERDGLSFHYLDEGDPSGRPFVFQHGLGGDVSQPAGVFSPPPGTRLVSLDCRGRGRTRPADVQAAIEGFLGRVFSLASAEEATKR